MATDCSSSSEQLEEEVSLSDLPHHSTSTKPDGTTSMVMKAEEEEEEEFDFSSSMRGSNFLSDTKMCAADELFFKGQILPLRLSVSSDCGLTNKPNNPTQRWSVSGFESMDRQVPSGPKSSRSSSCGSSTTKFSPNSSRSNSSSSTATTNTSIANSRPRVVPQVRNQFYTQPSPKPQIQISNAARLEKVGSRRSKKSSSSIWDFFRLGLVRTPEQDLKKVIRSNSARVTSTRISSVSRNSSVNSNNSTSTSTVAANVTISDSEKNNVVTSTSPSSLNNSENLKQRSRQRLFGDCRCSFEAVASNAVVPKSNVIFDKESEAKRGEKKADKVVAAEEVKMKMKRKRKKGSKQKKLKQDMSHQRTYEWLKGL